MEKVSSRIVVGVAGVAALVPGSALAAVVHVPVNSGSYSSYSTTVLGHSLDWNYVPTNGPTDFYNPTDGNYYTAWYSYDTNLLTGSGLAFTSGPLQSAGTEFDATDTYVSAELVQEKLNSAYLQDDGLGGYYVAYATTYSGPWNAPRSGYVGLEIEIGGQTHYGWAHFEAEPFLNWVNFTDYAYETTPNVRVFAGVVPEPASLALLAGGLAGLTTLRRRRKK